MNTKPFYILSIHDSEIRGLCEINSEPYMFIGNTAFLCWDKAQQIWNLPHYEEVSVVHIHVYDEPVEDGVEIDIKATFAPNPPLDDSKKSRTITSMIMVAGRWVWVTQHALNVLKTFDHYEKIWIKMITEPLKGT